MFAWKQAAGKWVHVWRSDEGVLREACEWWEPRGTGAGGWYRQTGVGDRGCLLYTSDAADDM
eukprot:1272650-Prorocentrum_lima.AAC.1